MNQPTASLCKPKSERIYYLDILRTIACLSVIMIHATADYIYLAYGAVPFWVGNILNSASRIAVPLFVMISGAMMLDSEYEYTANKLWSHIRKLILFFCFWSLLYTLHYKVIMPLHNGTPLEITSIVLYFFSGHYHLWFIYMQIALYLIVPILRLFVKHENKKYIEYFLCLAFVFTFLVPAIIRYGKVVFPIFDNVSNIFRTFNMTFVGGYTGYFILGWYLHNYKLKKNKLIYFLGVGGFIFTATITYLLSVYSGITVQAYSNASFNVLFQSVAVFVFVKQVFAKHQYGESFFSKVISIISKYSFGIYGIHIFFIEFTKSISNRLGIESIPLTILLVFVFSLIASVLCVAVLKRIPFINRFVC
ncbi:MAG: acyltransferase [Ruminococcus sp.]